MGYWATNTNNHQRLSRYEYASNEMPVCRPGGLDRGDEVEAYW